MGVDLNSDCLKLQLHISFALPLHCPIDLYGPHCQKMCKCMNGGRCDSMTGTCDCPPGFIRADCSQSKFLFLIMEGTW
jgi:hypothetical protein